MKLLQMFWRILKDETGIAPWIIPAAVSIGSALLGGKSKKGEESAKIYDPYSGLRGDWTNWLQSKIGTSTPYEYNSAFTLDQPEVEKAAESTILGKLQNPYKAADAKSALEASKTQQIAREKERAVAQQEEESNRYNRLGLVSSTPWLTRAGELGDESLMRQKDIETGMDVYGLEYGLKADQLAEQIANQWTNQAQTLGGAQRGYQKYSQGMSMNDIMRKVEEEMGYGEMAGSVLDANPAQRTVTTQGDDIWSILAGLGMKLGTQGLMNNVGWLQ